MRWEALALDLAESERLWRELLDVTARWRHFATRNGIPDAAQDQFAPALDRWSE